MELATRPWFSFLELWRLPFIGRIVATDAWLAFLFAVGWLVLIAAGVILLSRARMPLPPAAPARIVPAPDGGPAAPGGGETVDPPRSVAVDSSPAGMLPRPATRAPRGHAAPR